MDSLSSHLKNLREDFMKGTLHEHEMPDNPFDFFAFWMQQAVEAKTPEVQAMTLCTVSALGKPSSRVVYLREFNTESFTFYTNYLSRKGRDLEANPFASLSFFWPELERQIIIEGTVSKSSAEQSDAYFNARPKSSQIGAWASHQSEKISSRETLENKVTDLELNYQNVPVQRPPHWGGYNLKPTRFEFWQGRKSRLHDRLVYELENMAWKIYRLSP